MPKKEPRQEYVCVVPCRHRGHKFPKGRRVFFHEDELPRHKDGSVAHFELIGPETVIPVESENPVSVNAEATSKSGKGK